MSPADLVIAAINSLWQGAFLAALTALALRLLGRPSAAAASAVWTALFFVLVALPVVDMEVARAPAAATSPGIAANVVWPVGAASAFGDALSRSQAAKSLETVANEGAAISHSVSGFALRAGTLLLLLWCAVALVSAIRLFRAYEAARALKRLAVPLAASPDAAELVALAAAVRGARVGVSDAIDVPCAVGFRHPMVLIPSALAGRLAPDSLRATLVHELAHLQRYDDVVQAAQQTARALFFFNPVLYVAGRQVDFYREAACDDRVVWAGASPLRYAECLTELIERVAAHRRAAAPAIMPGRTQAFARVKRLLDLKSSSPTIGRAASLLALSLCVATAIVARVQVPLERSTIASAAGDISRFTSVEPETEQTLVHALSAAGLQPSVQELIDATNAGLDGDFVAAVARTGFAATLQDLMRLDTHGIDAPYVSVAVQAFGPSVAVDELIALQDAGVDESTLRDYQGVRGGLSVQDTIALAKAGVGPDDVCSLRAAGYLHSPISDIIALHDAGVDADYVNKLAADGYTNLSVHDVVRLHQAGVDG